MPTNLAIRRATPADASDLSSLARRAKASWGYPAQWLDAWVDDLTLTPEYLARHRAFVAMRAGAIIGVVVLDAHVSYWSLEHLWIDPAAQRTGVGRALVAHALAVAWDEREEVVRLASDPHAAPFYERLGAVQVGSIAAPMPGAADRELPLMEFTPA